MATIGNGNCMYYHLFWRSEGDIVKVNTRHLHYCLLIVASSKCLTHTQKLCMLFWHYCIPILRFCMESHRNSRTWSFSKYYIT